MDSQNCNSRICKVAVSTNKCSDAETMVAREYSKQENFDNFFDEFSGNEIAMPEICAGPRKTNHTYVQDKNENENKDKNTLMKKEESVNGDISLSFGKAALVFSYIFPPLSWILGGFGLRNANRAYDYTENKKYLAYATVNKVAIAMSLIPTLIVALMKILK